MPASPQPASSSAERPPWWRLALVGVLGGTLSGAFGIGGGILMVPLLLALTSMDQRRASATSLVAIVPAAVVGSIGFIGQGRVDWLAAALLSVGGIIGSWAGSRVLRALPLGWLRWLFISVLLLVALRMFFVGVDRGDAGMTHSAGSTFGLIVLGLVIGVASGLFGIGGGVVAVPALTLLFGMSDLTAKGTSLLMMLPTSMSGSVSHVRGRLVRVRDGLIVGAAAAAASFGGVTLAFTMTAEVSTTLFAVLLLLAAAQLAIRAIRHRG